MDSNKKIFNEILADIQALRRSIPRKFTREDAQDIYNQMGLVGKYDFEEFFMGINVELEHGTKGNWNITNNDPIMTAKIALVHMDESPVYYARLKKYVDPG